MRSRWNLRAWPDNRIERGRSRLLQYHLIRGGSTSAWALSGHGGRCLFTGEHAPVSEGHTWPYHWNRVAKCVRGRIDRRSAASARRGRAARKMHLPGRRGSQEEKGPSIGRGMLHPGLSCPSMKSCNRSIFAIISRFSSELNRALPNDADKSFRFKISIPICTVSNVLSLHYILRIRKKDS